MSFDGSRNPEEPAVTARTSYALKFRSGLSEAAMMDALNQVGPWVWRGSDSDRHGDHLWAIPRQGVKLRIFADAPAWIVQVRVLPDRGLTIEEVDRVLRERLFPAISATDIEPTETVA